MSSTEFGDLETLCKGIMKDKQPFERLEISKETLLEMFKVKSFPDLLIKREHVLSHISPFHIHITGFFYIVACF